MATSTIRSGLPVRRAAVILLVMPVCLILVAQTARATPGAELWVKRYDGPVNNDDYASDIGVGPDGSTVFVTGSSVSDDTIDNGYDYTTIAYDALTGARQWLSRYDGPVSGYDDAVAIDVSPDGSKIFVTGTSFGGYTTGEDDYATVAYDASSGNEVWAKRYDGGGFDFALALGVSPDGSTVFVTGQSQPFGYDYATVAYNASTGTRLWVSRYNGPGNGEDRPNALAVSPDSSVVFVTGGSSGGKTTRADYATVAYDSSSGSELWVKRYNGRGNGAPQIASALGASPDGSTVFVTGSASKIANYTTIAYDASSGTQLWLRAYNGPADARDYANALGVSPDGTVVFVTGSSDGGPTTFSDYATIAYGASAGTKLWLKRFNGQTSGGDGASALRVSPDGLAVFVTGTSDGGSTTQYDFATVSYEASTGARKWVGRYNGPGNAFDGAGALGVSADGSSVFVTGASQEVPFSAYSDYATIAYSTA